MKRYIRAAYDSSMPSWLKSEAGEDALESLNYKFAMSQAKFSRTETPDSIPIYLLDDTYKAERRWGETYKTPSGEYVFVPSSYGGYDRYISVGQNFRSLRTASKARIQEHIIDTVYMTAPLRDDIRKERDYVDPRYDSNWEYMGQVPEYGEHYNEETRKWEKDKTPYAWENPYDYGNRRDKSGYKIPNPEELYKRLYNRFPDRLKSRVDEAKTILDDYYDKINDAKSLIFAQYDIRKGKSIEFYGGKYYESVLYKLSEAIKDYGWLYEGFEKCMKDDGSMDSTKLASFLKSDDTFAVPRLTREIDKYVDYINSRLK